MAALSVQNFHCFRLAHHKNTYPPSPSSPSTISSSFSTTSSLSPFSSLKSTASPTISCISSTKTSSSLADEQPFVVSYLINSCGLSPESAISASRKVKFRSPENPDSVLEVLRDHGFSETQISKLVKTRPRLLVADPQTSILPKLQFLLSIGVPKSVLAKTLSRDPSILARSLQNRIVPSYNFLKTVLLSEERIASALQRASSVFLQGHSKNLVPNIEFLRRSGVSESCISLLLTNYPEALLRRHERFQETVKEVQLIGFDPKKSAFVLAIHALSGEVNRASWERCFEVYLRWGWSEDEIREAFKKHPNCMILSEEKITKAMEFLVTEMGWDSKAIAKQPTALFYSLEKRIKPRCWVAEVLVKRGLVKKDLSLASILVHSEEKFLEKFVREYEEEVPQLMSVYKGEVGFEEAIAS